MRMISRSRLVWITANVNTPNGARLQFPDQPVLRGKRITGIEAFNVTALAHTPDQQPVITAANAIDTTLTLKEASTDRQEQMPLFTLQVANTAGIWKEFRPFVVDWQKSFIQFFAAPAITLFTVPFLVYYLEDGEEIG